MPPSGFAGGSNSNTSSPAGARGYNSPGRGSGNASKARRALLSGGSSNVNAAAADATANKLQVQGAAAGNSGDGSSKGRRSTGDCSAGVPLGGSSRGGGSSNGSSSGSGGSISWQVAAAAAVPRDTAGPMGPELQEAVDQVCWQLPDVLNVLLSKHVQQH
jgi:hypothetical protein